MPCALGGLLLVAGASRLVNSFVTLVLPTYIPTVGPIVGLMPFGKIPIIFWLLIWRERVRPAGVAPTG